MYSTCRSPCKVIRVNRKFITGSVMSHHKKQKKTEKKTKRKTREWRDQTCWKRPFYTVCDGLSWFNIVKEWLKACTVNMITAGLYEICTQILIRSINSVSAVSDKLGHSCKAGLLASGGFTPRRNTHSCCWDVRGESGTLKETERSGWTRRQNRGSAGCKGSFFWSLRFIFSDKTPNRGWE